MVELTVVKIEIKNRDSQGRPKEGGNANKKVNEGKTLKIFINLLRIYCTKKINLLLYDISLLCTTIKQH